MVVNPDSWASLAVANEYAHLRSIPSSNIIFLDGVPGFEGIDVDTFRDTILEPVLDQLDRRGIRAQIDAIVYSADLPYAVDARKDADKTQLPPILSPVGSITGLTYLYELVEQKKLDYLHMAANFYARRLKLESKDTAWTEEEFKRYSQVFALFKEHKHAEAEAILMETEKAHPASSEVLYNLACCLALQGKKDDAMAALQRAAEAGWVDFAHTAKDTDLEGLRDRDDFKALLEKMKAVIFEVQPSRGFRNAYSWSPKGEVEGDENPRRYLLSTMLAVTSGRGTSVSQAVSCLRRSAAADGTAPTGAIYFMQNGDVRSQTRSWAFRSVVQQLKALGVQAEILEGDLPKGKPDVMGLMAGSADFNWQACGSTILPGAICEHLTSTGGVLSQDGGQTPLTVFLQAGAAGASGTVTEPHAIQAKFPLAFMHLHYAKGCSLAEAFYQSVTGPYQLLIVGDPLCAPWARPPKVRVEGVSSGAEVKGKLSLRPAAEPGKEGQTVRQFEFFVDGKRVVSLPPEKTYELDTSALADGYHELRVVGIADDAIETQGRVIVPLKVNNKGLSVLLTGAKSVPLDQPLTLQATSNGAKSISLCCGEQAIGRIEGEEGTLTVGAARLGLGPVRLQAVASFGGKEEAGACGEPLLVQVEKPTLVAAVELDKSAQLAQGILVKPENGEPAVVQSTRNGDWLLKAGVKKGQSFALEALFDVPADDLYQFQVRTPLTLSLTVGDRTFKVSDSRKWEFLPLHLKAGTHRVRIQSEGGDPQLDIRFGVIGTFSLDDKRFRHEALVQQEAGAPSAAPKE
jgi:tetratricopeptide (TPR) repeat protein